MQTGDIIKGTFSKCCNTSTSAVSGYYKNGEFIPRHYVCNKCRKETQPIIKDTWVITEKGKYKELQ